METMRAITLESFDKGPTLQQEIPTPQIAPNEVLVRAQASSVNPVDGAIAAGMLKDMVAHEFPILLGRDFSGVVEQAGEDVGGISEGDEVFGFVPGLSPKVHAGTWAEYITVPESLATRKPENIDAASAGAAPQAAITALSALDALGFSRGGGSGCGWSRGASSAKWAKGSGMWLGGAAWLCVRCEGPDSGGRG